MWLSGLWPTNQRVAGSIPSQCIWLGCRLGLWLGACKRQLMFLLRIDVSLPLSLPFPSF